jgi:hypothetical protein
MDDIFLNNRLTVSMPCYQRPQRTIRAIECIANQNRNGWQALIVGDCCPNMYKLMVSNYFSDIVNDCRKNGNLIEISNLYNNTGCWGYHIHNINRNRAIGKYFVFMDNDDVIKENHFHNYLSGIEGTDYDFVYYNSFIEPENKIRNSKLEEGHIGHSEIIIRTEFLREMKAHVAQYGHDWYVIREMMQSGAKHKKMESDYTYIVKGTPAMREQNID